MVVCIIDHLLVGHNILHDQIFVLFSNGLVQFLLVLAYQLLYVHIIVRRRLLMQTKRALRGHSRQSRLRIRLLLILLLLKHQFAFHIILL